jgi:hypothetical protein
MIAAPILGVMKDLGVVNSVTLGLAGFSLVLLAYVCSRVHGGLQDRVVAILVLGVFVIFFWAAFEQAGNVLTVWADKTTNRYITEAPKEPTVRPGVPAAEAVSAQGKPARVGWLERLWTMYRLKPPPANQPEQTWGQWFLTSLNPVPTAWFQTINAVFIVVLAPVFAWLWIWLDRRNLQPSIPMKMVLGLVFVSASMAVMMAAANREHQLTSVTLKGDRLPDSIAIGEGGQLGVKNDGIFEPFHAGRLTYDARTRSLSIYGVLTDNERDRLIETTAPEAYRKAVKALQEKSATLGDESPPVEVKISPVPPGFDMGYAGLKPSVVTYRSEDGALVAYQPLAEKEVKALLVAGGDPAFRDTVNQLYVESFKFRVSAWWLIWNYLLATMGELCLSPVGLSMVSKLAPARFATMLMGVWLLTNAFGNFVAGALGEIWGTIPPIQFFVLATAVVGGAALVLLVLVRLTVKLMHGVK